jgi:hypothetical protein
VFFAFFIRFHEERNMILESQATDFVCHVEFLVAMCGLVPAEVFGTCFVDVR